MHQPTRWPGLLVVLLTFGVGGAPQANAQEITLQQRPWTGEVVRPSGQPVIPLFEGWFENEDGSRTLCFGYFNLNTEEALEIPLGPDNFITPAELDGAQPTYFEPVPEAGYRRKWCAYAVDVPADFGPDDRVVWNLRSGGESLTTPGHILPPFVLDEPRSNGRGDVAPVLTLPGGAHAQGRRGFTTELLRARVGEPLPLSVQVEHPEGRAWVGWSKHQGPGEVVFSQAERTLREAPLVAETSAVFSEPGDYLLRIQAIDSLAAFEFHCCWTNAFVPVTVR